MTKTCQQRIEEQLQGRLEHLRILFAVIDGDDLEEITEDKADLQKYGDMSSDDAYDELHDLALGVDEKMVVTIQISTGGPGDQFEVDLSKDDRTGRYTEIEEIRYRFLDWFDGAMVRLTGDEYELVERYVQSVLVLE